MTTGKQNLTVLLTACGAPGAPCIIDALRANGEREIRIVGTDSTFTTVGSVLCDAVEKVPMGSSGLFIPHMRSMLSRYDVDVIFPLTSMELAQWSQQKRYFMMPILVSDVYPTYVALNKRVTYERLCRVLPEYIPQYAVVSSVDAYDQFADIGDLFCIKPEASKGSRGFRVIHHDKTHLSTMLASKPYLFLQHDTFRQMLVNAEWIPPFLAMEYLPGYEYTVDALCCHGEVLVAIPRWRQRTVHGITVRGMSVKYDDLIEASHRIVEALGFDYLVNLQFKYTMAGQPKLLEINPRVAGTVAVSVESGVNLPYLAVKMALGESFTIPPVQWETQIQRYWSHVVT